MIEANQLIQIILDGLSELYEVEFGVAALDALSSVFATFKQAIPLSSLQALSTLLPKLLELVLENLAQLESGSGNQQQDDDDDEEGDGFVDSADEEEVLYAWGRLQATLFEVFPSAAAEHAWCLSFIHKRFTTGAAAGKKKRTSATAATAPQVNEAFRHAAMGVLCDWMVWCGQEGALQHGQVLIDCVTPGILHQSPLIRQAAVHLSGLLASRGGPAFRDFCLQLAQSVLLKALQRPDCQAPSQLAITDNVIASLIRIHRAYGLAPSDGALIEGMLMPGLPVMTDEAEVLGVLEFLASAWNPQASWAQEVKARHTRMTPKTPKERELLSQILA